jgi:hypothetical protein
MSYDFLSTTPTQSPPGSFAFAKQHILAADHKSTLFAHRMSCLATVFIVLADLDQVYVDR